MYCYHSLIGWQCFRHVPWAITPFSPKQDATGLSLLLSCTPHHFLSPPPYKVETPSVMQSLLIVFAHLASTEQLEGLISFLSQVPDPNGRPALEYVVVQWCSNHVSGLGLVGFMFYCIHIAFFYMYFVVKGTVAWYMCVRLFIFYFCRPCSLVIMNRESAQWHCVSCCLIVLILVTRDWVVLWLLKRTLRPANLMVR